MIRSADLVHKLTADPERPWAEYNRGDPITQRQLARILSAFGIISVNVRPEVGPQSKGYRRTDFEEAWEAYCPGQNLERTDSDAFKRPNVPRPVESAQVDGFASVPEAIWDGSKNGNLSNNHAGWDAGTDREPEIDARTNLTTTETPSDDPGGNPCSDPGPIPESLRRHRCDHCGGAVGTTRNYDWPDRPYGVWLHSQCEAPWFDLESPSARRADRRRKANGGGAS